MRDSEQINLTKRYKGDEHDHHRTLRIAAAAQRCSKYMVHAVEEQEKGIMAYKQNAIFNHRGILRKQADRRSGKDDDDRADHRRHRYGHRDRNKSSSLCAFVNSSAA